MTQAAVNAEQVAALLAERQKYESWIGALEDKRAETPSHIYDRVHADYAARLQRVREQLAQHGAAIREMEASLVDRLTSLDIDEAKQRDEAAEAALRAMVGELSAELAREVEQRTRSRIDTVAGEREQVTRELERLRAVLAAGAGQSEAPRAPTPAPAPAVPASPPAGDQRRDWELAADKAAVAPARPAEPPAEAAPPARTSAERPAAASGRGPFDDLEFLKTIDSGTKERRPDIASRTPAPAGATAASSRSERASGEITQPQPARVVEAPTIRHTEEPTLNIREQAPDQVKTLKCQECGTLNYPTEWYCERCGAELAAL